MAVLAVHSNFITIQGKTKINGSLTKSRFSGHRISCPVAYFRSNSDWLIALFALRGPVSRVMHVLLLNFKLFHVKISKSPQIKVVISTQVMSFFILLSTSMMLFQCQVAHQNFTLIGPFYCLCCGCSDMLTLALV